MIKIVDESSRSKRPTKCLGDIPYGMVFRGRVMDDLTSNVRIRVDTGYLNLEHLDWGTFPVSDTKIIHDFEEVDLEIRVIDKR